MEAGFAITASWPINTEAEGSLHTRTSRPPTRLFLVCRPLTQPGPRLVTGKSGSPRSCRRTRAHWVFQKGVSKA